MILVKSSYLVVNFKKESRVTVGPLLKELIRSFRVPFAFVGVDGYDDELGFYWERYDEK